MNTAPVIHPGPASFSELPVGARFRFPYMAGYQLLRAAVYVKTGPESYGLVLQEPMWTWGDDAPFVEVVP